jgi:phosphomethylpyrimidine synthase
MLLTRPLPTVSLPTTATKKKRVTLTRALPASRKVYIEGSRPDIQVPMREITLTDTPVGGFGKAEGEKNPPFYVYDTSGVYTDPNVEIDLTKGLPKLRESLD